MLTTYLRLPDNTFLLHAYACLQYEKNGGNPVKREFFSGKFCFSALMALVSFAGVVSGAAQTNSYQQTNLVSDMAGVANNTDPKLVNPWGISFFPGSTFWVADNKSGYSTIYDANGASQFSVLIPAPAGDASPATPTGLSLIHI